MRSFESNRRRLALGLAAAALTLAVTLVIAGVATDDDQSGPFVGSGPRSLSACALSIGVLVASYIGTPINPLGGYMGVVAGSAMFALFC